MKFTGICFATTDIVRLITFCKSVLSVEVEGDDIHVELCTAGARYGSFTLGFEADDVDAEYERLKALDVAFVKLPQSYPWGTRSVCFRDPDGNIVNFYAVL